MVAVLLICFQASATGNNGSQIDSPEPEKLSEKKKAELNQLRRNFRENSENEIWELEHGSLHIEINSLGKFGGMLLIAKDKESGRVVFSEQNGEGIWNNDSILLYQGKNPVDSSLLALKLGGGEGMGSYDVDIHVYLLRGIQMNKIYTDDFYGYSNMGMEAGGFTSNEHEYKYNFEQNLDGHWVMTVTGSSKESTPRNETSILKKK